MRALYRAFCACGWSGYRFVEAADTRGRKCRACGGDLTHEPSPDARTVTPDGQSLRWSPTKARWENAA